MILDQVNPYEVKKFSNTQGSEYPAGAPLAQQNGVGNQLKDAVISQGVNQMAGSMMGAGASGAAGAAAMNPYTLPIMLGMSMLNEGGQVGPLGTQYAAGGDKVYSIPDPFVTEAELLKLYDRFQRGYTPAGSGVKMNQSYEDFRKGQGMKFSEGGQVDPINQILDELEAEEASQLVEGAIGPSQAMQFPLARPVNLMQEVMPEGKDITYSPYEMLRPDNAPNT